MRRWVYVAFAVLSTVACSLVSAHAGELACEDIKDADQRHFCRAVTGAGKAECELIKDGQLRAQCRAHARAQ